MKCQYCENAIPDGAKFCPACGAPIKDQTGTDTPVGELSDRSLNTFLLLSFLPLPLGQGFFYIRNPRLGVGMLLVSAVAHGMCGAYYLMFMNRHETWNATMIALCFAFALCWSLQVFCALFIKKDGDGKLLKK